MGTSHFHCLYTIANNHYWLFSSLMFWSINVKFLWNTPIFIFELGLNLIFWGSIIAVLVLIFKWGTEKYIEKFRKDDWGNDDPEDYIV